MPVRERAQGRNDGRRLHLPPRLREVWKGREEMGDEDKYLIVGVCCFLGALVALMAWVLA